jgi:hypothetical protein
MKFNKNIAMMLLVDDAIQGRIKKEVTTKRTISTVNEKCAYILYVQWSLLYVLELHYEVKKKCYGSHKRPSASRWSLVIINNIICIIAAPFISILDFKRVIIYIHNLLYILLFYLI